MRKSAHADYIRKRIEDSQSEFFVHDEKVTLDDVKDWECKHSENPRMVKIRKSNNLACRKIVNNKKCHAWVTHMKKSKETKCVVQSKLSDDDHIVGVSNVFCEDIAKHKRNVKKPSVKPSKLLRKIGTTT